MQLSGTGKIRPVDHLIEPLREIIGDNKNADIFINKVLWELQFFATRQAIHPKKEPFEDNQKAASNMLKRSKSASFLKNKSNKDIFLSELEDLRGKYGHEYINIIPTQGLAFIQVLQKMLETYQEACSKSCETIDQIIHGFIEVPGEIEYVNKGGKPKGSGFLKEDFARTIASLFETVLQKEITGSMPGKKPRDGGKFARVIILCFGHVDADFINNSDSTIKKLIEKINKERKNTPTTRQ